MLNDTVGYTEVTGLTVYDMVLVKHLIEKLLRAGGITGQELSFVAGLREKALAACIAVNANIEETGSKPVPQGEVS